MTDLTDIKVGIARIEEQLKAQGEQINKLAPAAEVAQLRHDIADLENQQRDFEREVNAKIEALGKNVPTLGDHNAHEERTTKLESNQSWVIRSVVGAVITAIMGLVVLKTKLLGG